MARKQVLVQLDDELITQLDAIAERRGVSRSELVRRAATVLVEADEELEADQQLRASYRERPQDPVLNAALWRLAAATMPEW